MITRDWHASWIWPLDERAPNTHVLFRKDVELKRTPPHAWLYIATESFARVWVNGQEMVHTSSLSYPGQHYYEEIDITRALQAGLNRISVLGWYIGIPSGACCLKDPGLLAEIVIQDGDHQQSVGTDASWLCLRLDAWQGKLRRSHWYNLDLLEIRDDRLLPAGFPTPVDLSRFVAPHADAYQGRHPHLEKRPFPKCDRWEDRALTLVRAGLVTDRSAAQTIPALAVSEEAIEEQAFELSDLNAWQIEPTPHGKAFSAVFALGDYKHGYPAFAAHGAPGTVIDVSWEEDLKDGRLDVRDKRAYATDRFILGSGPSAIQPEEWKGGRFLQLTFRNVSAPLAIQDLRWIREEYPVRRKAYFRSANETLNRIFEISVRAAHMCMHDNIMDCPWREKRQWIGDAQRIGLINHYAFADTQLLRGVLKQHVHLQHPSGRMWVCMPLWEEYPVQSMAWLRAVLEYEAYTGDETLLAEVANNVEMLHRWFLSCRDDHGLFFNPHPPICNWVDNGYQPIRKHGTKTAFLAQNLRYLLFLEDVAFALQRLGREADARDAAQERQALARRIPEIFLDQASGLLRDCADPAIAPTFSEMGHALAVRTRIAGAESQALWDAYNALARENPEQTISPSPFGKYHTLQMLGELGRTEELLEEILTHWGPMVEAGADTTWEWFGTVARASHCHGWAGIPVVMLFEHMLKLDPRHAGTKRSEGVGPVAWMEGEIRL